MKNIPLTESVNIFIIFLSILRLVFDRENGKPKGYGFCEFLDQETALSALRNLNQFEFHGRTLRVDTAAGDRSKEELRRKL